MSLLEIDDDDVIASSAPQTCGPGDRDSGESEQARLTATVTSTVRGFDLDDLFGSTQDVSSTPHPPDHVGSSEFYGTNAHSIHTSSLRNQAQTANRCMPSAKQKRPATTTGAGNVDELDNLFAAAIPGTDVASRGVGSAMDTPVTGIHVGVDDSAWGDKGVESNLLDLSRPIERQRYGNAEMFLDAFERHGAGRKNVKPENIQDNLGNLTRNKDDNKVRARLLSLMNYYDVLGVDSSASVDEIKRSYKRKALELHPDKVGRNQTPEEADLFKIIARAHEILTDSSKRTAYDAEQVLRQADANADGDSNWWQHLNTS